MCILNTYMYMYRYTHVQTHISISTALTSLCTHGLEEIISNMT